MACKSSGKGSFRGAKLPQAGGRGMIEVAVGGDCNAVVAFRRLARDEPVGDIEGDLLGIALASVAEAAAARQFEANEVAARHALPAFGPDRRARDQGDPARRADAAALAAPRRVADPLEI